MPLTQVQGGMILPSTTLTTPIVATTMGVGGATPAASGSGITFPATQSASTDANTLDDYEEGTWTPVITNGSVNVTSYYWQLGYYVKIGKNVFISMQISVNVVGPISGNIRIDGLPFAAGNPTGYNIYTLYGSKYSPTTNMVVYLLDTATSRLVPSFPTSYPTQLTSSDLGSGGQWSVQGWYITNN